MEIFATDIPDVIIAVPRRIADERGAFVEVWNQQVFAEAGIAASFVQDNHVSNPLKGTLRGLHYQLSPRAQGKLVRVTRGAIFDVAVDVRRGSPTYGASVAGVLSADNRKQIWIPAGFAHGYCTLEDDTEVLYKVTDFYSPEHERGIAWNDPQIAIKWPLDASLLLLSDRDRRHPSLSEQPDVFDEASHSDRRASAAGTQPRAEALSKEPA